MSLCLSVAVIMKLTSTLFAVLAIIGLGQARQFPDFGSGPLHEDIHDFLDLIPAAEIKAIILDYVSEDAEVREIVNYLLTSTVLRDLVVDVEAIPEVINFLNYVQHEGVDIYLLVNEVNKVLGIAELIPPSHAYSANIQRTSGVAGLFKDIKKVIPFNKFIRTYVQKMKSSSAFIGFIHQLRSPNFQQLVNKLYQVRSFQIIVNGLKSRGVNTQIVADVMYIVLGITVPNGILVHQERTLDDELMDFLDLIEDPFVEVLIKYMAEDQKVQDALRYMFTPEFHSILRDVEVLEEHQALVAYLEKAGLSVVDYIQSLHKAIGMEGYVPPKIESVFESQVGMQKVGDGMKGMIEELWDTLPIDEIDVLYKDKLQNSKVFADFIEKIMSPEMQKLIDNLYGNQTYKNFVTTTREKGLELQEVTKLTARIFGLKFPY
ncbi:uncharacterized protein LOC143896617 [Temnothorax americanus]|uniref:uncharacterized protein LOC143896617 n=1 Tax=Temnothorax americanus TaxID=1964332 RepID=UPI004068CC00